jgi:hypothetical protein
VAGSEQARTVFEEIRIWDAAPVPVPAERILEGLAGADAEFVGSAYAMAESLYSGRKKRNNGDPAFTHPTHVALFLKLAAAQPHVIAAGLLHDVLEDRAEAEGATKDPIALDRALMGIRAQFASAVVAASDRALFPRDVAERVVEIVWTLTRHKAHMYYRSISAIFRHHDMAVRVGAALVKLADRMHNIQTIENYADDEKLYQCFKNIFILNNAKQLREEVHARPMDRRMVATLEKAFKKSGKATFQALLRIQHQARPGDRVFDMLTYLALALQKFVLEIEGLWKVTHADLRPGAPVWNLYHGIVEKYDHRLHREDDTFEAHLAGELDYCRATFVQLDLSEDDLRRAMFFKDAMALAEVVGSLLYKEDYVIRGFECGRLCRRGNDCMKRQRGG